MKKIIMAALCSSLILCLCPVHTWASGTILDDWMSKLETLISDSSEDYAEEEPEEQGAYSPGDLYDMTAPKVVEILTFDSSGDPLARGSGFFIDENGTFVTNFHVIEDAYSAEIQMYDGTTAAITKVRGYDAFIDLAILNADVSGNPCLKMSDREIRTGDTIYTLGSALGLSGTFSDGLVATASREIDGVDYIQITAPISHGNSGGPLINIYGEVIGVNTMFYTEGQNVNFAVNIHELTKLDVTNPVSLEELYEQTGGGTSQVGGLDIPNSDVREWMSDADSFEIESNDSFDWADMLQNTYIMGGYVNGTEDFDVFGIRAIEGTTIDILIVPYYDEDLDYLVAGLMDEEGNVLGFAEEDEYDDLKVLSILEEVETPGTYYLALCVVDDYPYSEPAYYVLDAVW